jgi:RNA polymerase sigma factor (sigma-70 family)
MSMSQELSTTSLLDLVARFQGGDAAALDELVRRIGGRLERLAHKMLRGFPVVRGQEQTGDVLQNALVRLSRSLRAVCPASTADFFRLAAEQLRRELLDLARYHRRRLAVNEPFPPAGSDGSAVAFDPPDRDAPDARDLDRWQALHEAVERLPADLREVFGLTFYHGQTQPQIAGVLGVSDRHVRRLWRESCVRLNDLLGGDLPPS